MVESSFSPPILIIGTLAEEACMQVTIFTGLPSHVVRTKYESPNVVVRPHGRFEKSPAGEGVQGYLVELRLTEQ